MDIEIRKNVPLPDSRAEGSLPPGRKKSKVRIAVEQLEEKMRAKVIRCMVHHRRRPNSKEVSRKKLATRLRQDEDNGQFYLGAWRTQ